MSWPQVKLCDVVDINPPGPRSGLYSDDDLFDFVPMASVSEQGHMSVSEQRPYSDVKKGFTSFKNNDVILAKITPCFENNKITRAEVTSDYAFGSTEFHVLRSKDEKLDPSYLAYFLRQDSVRASGERRMTGSGGQRRVPKAFLEELEIPLPPLEEQKRIAGILDQADALRRLRARALEKLNTLGQAVFQEMFGEELNRQPNESTQKIGDLCHRLSVGVVIKPASYYVDEGVPAIRGTNIKPRGIDLKDVVYFSESDSEGPLKKSVLRKGDVVAVRSGRPGLAAVVPEELDGANSIDILFSTPNTEKLLPIFLCDFMNSPIGKQKVFSEARGQVQQHFNVKSWSETEINLPSLKRQMVYADKIAAIEEQSVLLEAASRKAEATFASLQSAAFQGKL